MIRLVCTIAALIFLYNGAVCRQGYPESNRAYIAAAISAVLAVLA